VSILAAALAKKRSAAIGVGFDPLVARLQKRPNNERRRKRTIANIGNRMASSWAQAPMIVPSSARCVLVSRWILWLSGVVSRQRRFYRPQIYNIRDYEANGTVNNGPAPIRGEAPLINGPACSKRPANAMLINGPRSAGTVAFARVRTGYPGQRVF
jgi:hypothetical protein